MDEMDNRSFVFHRYPDDLERMERWMENHIRGLASTYSPAGPSTYLLLSSDDTVVGVLTIAPDIVEHLTYDQYNHIIQRLSWKTTQGR